MKKITLKDIATKAGVSTITASRALNNHPYVKPEIRRAVTSIASEMGYAPPSRRSRHHGKSAGRKKALTRVGFVTFPSYNKYTEPMFGQLLEEADRVLLSRNLQFPFLYRLDELKDPDLFESVINPTAVDGLIFVGTGENYKQPIFDIKAKVPNCLVLEALVNDPDIVSVSSDNNIGGDLATSHLIQCGHRRIGCITGYFDYPSHNQQALNGYLQALRREGYSLDEGLITEGRYTTNSAEEAAYKLLTLPEPPTAIFVVSEPMVPGVYRAIQKLGMKIPDDVAVASCGNIRASQHLYPTLTSTEVDFGKMASFAIDELTDQFDKIAKPARRILFPVDLAIRESTTSNN